VELLVLTGFKVGELFEWIDFKVELLELTGVKVERVA
jgi:hypothetical protein